MSTNITIYIPKIILEDKKLNHIEKLIHSITFSLSRKGKLGFNAYTNKELSELLSVDSNSLGKHRKRLVELGYERKEKGGKYYLNDKVKVGFKSGGTILPPQVYTLKKLSAGAKLLWSLYNSLDKGRSGYCNAKRETLAERLNCSVESITSWSEQLNERGLFEYFELLSGKNSRQRRVKTRKFEKEEITDGVTVSKKEDTSLETIKTVDKESISEAKKKIDQLVKIISVEHSDAEEYWRDFMNGVESVKLTDYNEVEGFLWKVSEKIDKSGLNKEEVFQKLYDEADSKLNITVGVEELKRQLRMYTFE